MPNKGYGFLEPEDGSADLFCHLTAVQASGRDTLPEGAAVTHSPDAVIHSPGETMAAWPTTVIRSRCPRAFVLRTQKPFSGLWKVTRSTSPARTSRSEDSGCWPAPGFTTSRGRERSAEPSPAGPGRPPRRGPETCPGQHRQMPTRRVPAAQLSLHACPDPSSAASPFDTLVAITGGKDIANPAAVIERLDKARAKYADIILVHGGGPGVEKIAASWAERNGVHQIVCKPDWDRHGRAAPFRRNEELLNLLPKGVIAFPGSGITENLVDKARQLGIPVQRIAA